MKHSLEGHRLFPVIAWVTFISFTLFVGHLSLVVSKQIAKIEGSTVVYAQLDSEDIAEAQ